jgi:hypothetical protein
MDYIKDKEEKTQEIFLNQGAHMNKRQICLCPPSVCDLKLVPQFLLGCLFLGLIVAKIQRIGI